VRLERRHADTYQRDVIARTLASSAAFAALVALAAPAVADVGPPPSCPKGKHHEYYMGHRCVTDGYHLSPGPHGVDEVKNGDPDPNAPVPPKPEPSPVSPPTAAPAAPSSSAIAFATPPPAASANPQPPAVPQPGPKGCAVGALGESGARDVLGALAVAALAAFALRRKR
jgi:MYXO-CTERM domain-containing protein